MTLIQDHVHYNTSNAQPVQPDLSGRGLTLAHAKFQRPAASFDGGFVS